MDPLRIYPLRLNKRTWKIPLHSTHKCSRACSKTFVRDEDDPHRFLLIDNPDYVDGKCSRSGKLTPGNVKLADFDINEPMGIFGPLHNPEEVVIPDRKINIDITYPIINPIHTTIDFGHDNITRKELLQVIHTLYKHIYEEEERTSPPSIYTVATQCEECYDNNAEDHIEDTECDNEECSICYDGFSQKEPGKLPCGHIFHKECILQWLNQPNNTCPYCRGTVSECENCDNEGWVMNQYEAVVIPLEHRGVVLNRNTTHGVFGIYGHDLEDLTIRSMKYNRIEKHLSIEILA